MNVSPKLAASSIAGSITLIVVWVTSLFGLEMPPEVASAFTVIFSFLAGYIKSV